MGRSYHRCRQGYGANRVRDDAHEGVPRVARVDQVHSRDKIGPTGQNQETGQKCNEASSARCRSSGVRDMADRRKGGIGRGAGDGLIRTGSTQKEDVYCISILRLH